MDNLSVIVTGVSGQGVTMTAKIIAKAAANCGCEVKMLPRGNFHAGRSSSFMIRYGEKVFSPYITKGEADVIISLEKLECARQISYLKTSGAVFTSNAEVLPETYREAGEPYPKKFFDNLAMLGINAIECDTETIDRMCENSHADGVVLLALAIDELCLPKEAIRKAINECLDEKEARSSINAFDIGLSMRQE